MCILKYILTPLIALWHVLLAGCYTVTLKRIAPPVEPTMFVQVFQTFSALNDFWLTTPSNPLEFLTDQSSFFSSIQISTFFCCNCIVFAVRGVPMLRVQEYQETLLCLSMILKLFQCCTIVGSPFCPILSIFQQLDVLFCLLYEYQLFFTVDVLCSLSEAIRYSGFRNITILKLLSR